MRTIGNAFIGIGVLISVISACCVDSAEPYGTLALLTVAIGGVIAGVGYGIRILGERRKEQIVQNFYFYPRKDRLDADIEIIAPEMDAKEIAPQLTLTSPGAITDKKSVSSL